MKVQHAPGRSTASPEADCVSQAARLSPPIVALRNSHSTSGGMSFHNNHAAIRVSAVLNVEENKLARIHPSTPVVARGGGRSGFNSNLSGAAFTACPAVRCDVQGGSALVDAGDALQCSAGLVCLLYQFRNAEVSSDSDRYTAIAVAIIRISCPVWLRETPIHNAESSS